CTATPTYYYGSGSYDPFDYW
nr:immunoglobulin heavy chain junction region [Macaca mulatta]MOW94873.1 immunoglobulin heavy chain junction region [Macaca mulatta]MOW96458.1 immunoglobulin heavy chain junction region [Macaca mulatta]MOW96923.1 immunoglobulin heavy chain junction region [Macaca mulatta]MOW97038.1 immunoglobulin heavy chain junction region [Macaca mulatta]